MRRRNQPSRIKEINPVQSRKSAQSSQGNQPHRVKASQGRIVGCCWYHASRLKLFVFLSGEGGGREDCLRLWVLDGTDTRRCVSPDALLPLLLLTNGIKYLLPNKGINKQTNNKKWRELNERIRWVIIAHRSSWSWTWRNSSITRWMKVRSSVQSRPVKTLSLKQEGITVEYQPAHFPTDRAS